MSFQVSYRSLSIVFLGLNTLFVFPGKMKFNLQSIKEFSFIGEIKTMLRTAFAVLGKDYSEEEQESRT